MNPGWLFYVCGTLLLSGCFAFPTPIVKDVIVVEAPPAQPENLQNNVAITEVNTEQTQISNQTHLLNETKTIRIVNEDTNISAQVLDTLKQTVNPDLKHGDFSYQSEDEAIAVIDKFGNVTPLKKGLVRLRILDLEQETLGLFQLEVTQDFQFFPDLSGCWVWPAENSDGWSHIVTFKSIEPHIYYDANGKVEIQQYETRQYASFPGDRMELLLELNGVLTVSSNEKNYMKPKEPQFETPYEGRFAYSESQLTFDRVVLVPCTAEQKQALTSRPIVEVGF